MANKLQIYSEIESILKREAMNIAELARRLDAAVIIITNR